MSHARERLVERFERAADRGYALEAECYRNPDFFALEVEHVLRPGWHAVARWDELPEPGDYASVDLFGEPLLVVRDGAGALRVLSRVCRHRAHTVVEGTGHTKRFVCPYHRWSYGLDGELVTAPLMEGIERSRCGLPELRSESWQGFLLVSLDSGAKSLSQQLPALDAELTPFGLAEMVSVGVLEFESPWNWKVMVDNFMESYHHLGPHRESLQKTNPAKQTYCMDLEGPFALLDNPGVAGNAGLYVGQVFPTLLFALLRGQQAGFWYEMQIDDPERFHLRIHMLADPKLAAHDGVAELFRDSARRVHLEDIAVCEGVQRGLRSRLWQPGPLSRHEGALTRFHRYLATQLARDTR